MKTLKVKTFLLFVLINTICINLSSQYLVPLSGSTEITAITGTVTDHAGESGTYSNSCNGYLVVYPNVSSDQIQISGSTAGESCCDYLKIYNGVGTSGTLLWSGVANAGTVPLQTSTDATGALTIQFTSDGSVTGNGFLLNIDCIINSPPGPPVTPVVATPIDGDPAYRGTTVNWANGAGYSPDGYKLWFGTDNPPTNILENSDQGNTTTYTPSLTAGETYYWKAQAYNSYGVSDVSDVFSFTTFSGVEIGSGTSSDYTVPFYTYYNYYTYTQTIYQQSDINMAGLMTKIWLDNASTSYENELTELNIYMGTKSNSTFDNTSDWVALEDLTLVYSGNLTIPISDDWLEITLDNPYYYTNTNNLVIVYDLGDNYRTTPGCYMKFNYTSVSNSVLRKNNSSDIDPATPGTGSLMSYLPNILMAITAFDPGVPAKPIVLNPNDNATDVWGESLNWKMGLAYPPEGYNLYLGTDNPPTNIVNGEDLGNITSYSPTLEFGKEYFWKVKAYNSYGESEETSVYSFETFDLSPNISSISSDSPNCGDTIIITGTGFDPTIENNIVYFGGSIGEITSVNSTGDSICVVVPLNVTAGYININVNGKTGYSQIPYYPIKGVQQINADLFNTENVIASNIDAGSYANVNIEIVDFDLDGKPDIACIDDGEAVRVLRNSGTTCSLSFTEQATLSHSGIEEFTIGDFDGNGLVDIASMASNYQINIFLNTSVPGTISFSSAQTFSPSGLEYGPGALTACDLNYDNKADIFIAAWNEYCVLTNTHTSGTSLSFDISTPLYEGAGGTYKAVTFGDLDIDGDMDIVAEMNNGGGSHQAVYWQNNTNPGGSITFGAMQNFHTPSGYAQSLDIGDLDKDGKPDIVLASGSDVDVIINTNTEVGTISLATAQTITTGGTNSYYTYQTKIADLNGDGYPEIIHSNGTIYVIQNTSAAKSTTFGTVQNVGTGYDFAVIDADLDNYDDLVVNKSGSTLVAKTSNTPPSVSTADISITNKNVTLGGTVADQGGDAVTERGICYSTIGTPTTSDTKAINGSGIGSFTDVLSGFLDNTTYYVRAYAINSYGTAYGITKAFSIGTQILPVELLSFEAKFNGKQVDLFWSTASEINADYFTIYKSKDAKKWENIGIVNANGNSSFRNNYQHTDNEHFYGINYYKLTQTDFDSYTHFEGISSVVASVIEDLNVLIYPNPCSDKIKISINDEVQGPIIVSILNTSGTLIHRFDFQKKDDLNNSFIEIGKLKPSVYILKIETINKCMFQKITKY